MVPAALPCVRCQTPPASSGIDFCELCTQENVENPTAESIQLLFDQAILDAVVAGKDIVLTGNPGDGKTHIIRIDLRYS
jgi:DNA replication protein DnaC